MAAFHLAFFVRDLGSTRRFYGEIFGNQISAHTTGGVTPTQSTGKVEDLLVPMPHFGAILPWEQFDAIAGRVRAAGMAFILSFRHPEHVFTA